jgi:hypothetical protein
MNTIFIMLFSLLAGSIVIPYGHFFGQLIPAFGDGLFEEKLSASLGNRNADLYIKMSPPVVTTETISNQAQKPVIQFRLFDSTTNESVNHVTYLITIEKGDKRLLTDWFHDHAGDLRIQMSPRNASQIVVNGEQDPILNAYTGTPQSPVIASGPIFQEGGLYHFIIQIAGVDYDRTLLPENQQPIFDGYLSIGNTQNYTMPIDGKQLPVEITSYYDKLKMINFDQNNKQLNFEMPFDWNLSRIKDVNIFVHQEVSIPKPSPFASNVYSGTVNGLPASKMLMVDPSNPKTDIVHFMIAKNNLISLAEQVNNDGQASSGIMKFSLSPSIGQEGTGNMSMTMSPMSPMSSTSPNGSMADGQNTVS